MIDRERQETPQARQFRAFLEEEIRAEEQRAAAAARRRKARREAIKSAYASVGMVKVRGNLGGTYYE